MSRKSNGPKTAINFRLDDELLKEIDALANQNLHDRTAEISGACRHWIEIGGSPAIDKTTYDRIDELEKLALTLQSEAAEFKQQEANLSEQIKILSDELKYERNLLLTIINTDKSTIETLCSKMPEYHPKQNDSANGHVR